MPQHRIEAGALATIGIRDISSSVQVSAEKPTDFSDKIMRKQATSSAYSGEVGTGSPIRICAKQRI